jgi:hypothetical protein
MKYQSAMIQIPQKPKDVNRLIQTSKKTIPTEIDETLRKRRLQDVQKQRE